jgi:hypothetical protein
MENLFVGFSIWRQQSIFMNRIQKILMMVYDTQIYWGSGLCPLSGGGDDGSLLGPLEGANLIHWT